jgi:hypothetical protein
MNRDILGNDAKDKRTIFSRLLFTSGAKLKGNSGSVAQKGE